MQAVTETYLAGARLSRRGKVRDIYDLGDSLLLVASDRISAYDSVLQPGVPDKGKILTQLSNFWFASLPEIENHLLETEFERFPEVLRDQAAQIAGRSVLVRKAQVIPFECVARGYLAGSGWSDYKRTGAVCGIALPPGLIEAQRLPDPIFTPATKNERGHDENVPFSHLVQAIGSAEASWLRDTTLELYRRAREYSESRGLIVADTKVEFGRFDGRIIWIDEAFTPDSSRYWDAALYRPGHNPASYDKQFVRDWLDSTGWDRRPPPPRLPEGVVRTTREKYLESYRLLTGSLPRHLGPQG